MAGFQRHFHQRLLGGVCGGLASRLAFSAAFWRALFLLLCPLTLGAAAFLYLALWFWLPTAAPTPTLPSPPRQPLRRAILLSLALVGVLGSGALWRAGRLAPVDAALVLVLLGGALLTAAKCRHALLTAAKCRHALLTAAKCRHVLASCSDLRPRGAFALPLIALSLPLVLLIWRSGALSPGLADALERAAPATLLLFGLRALGRGYRPERNRAVAANAFALCGTGALCVGVAALAFARHDARLRDDTREQAILTRALPADLRLLRLELSAIASDIIVERALAPLPQISGTYVGGANLMLALECNGDRCAEDGRLPARADGTADLLIRESQREAFPPLRARGRGELRLQLPADAPLDLLIRSGAGEIILSLGGLQLERLNVELARGDALVSLPHYAPLGTPRGEAIGGIALAEGNLTLRLPAGLDARLPVITAGDAEFPRAHFAREGDALVAIAASAEGGWSHLQLSVVDGTIRLLVVEE